MKNYSQHFNPNVTPQSEQAKPNQVLNAAGGYVFQVTEQQQLERFLVLGCDGGTYYAGERELTRKNAKNLVKCLDKNPVQTVETIVQMSDSGRIPKNETAVFALAVSAAHSDPKVRALACSVMPKICRTGTHLFQFISQVDEMRGWGRTLKKGVASWYNTKDPDQLAYQAIKYQNRFNWSHRDVLRKAHVYADNPGVNAVLRYLVSGSDGLGPREVVGKKSLATRNYPAVDTVPALLSGYEQMKRASSVAEVVSLIETHNFTREMIPTQWLNEVKVWEALLMKMPITAMIRNLGKMSAVGLLKPLSVEAKFVADRISNRDILHKGRVHPIQLLSAAMVYGQGHGEKGSLSWLPVDIVKDALNDGFYESFKNIQPTGKAHLIGLDVSPSMSGGVIAGVPGLTPAKAAAVMAMVTARVEKNYQVMAFGSSFVPIDISPKDTLDSIVRKTSNQQWQGTDCSLPCKFAQYHRLKVDAFLVMTDNETWAGGNHPYQALLSYRNTSGINSKMAVVGFTATDCSIADPSDAGMLDFAGFDSAAPQLMADFIRG